MGKTWPVGKHSTKTRIVWIFRGIYSCGVFDMKNSLKLKLKHFIGLPYTGFANAHAKYKTLRQLSTDRGQNILQYSNNFFIVLFRELVTRIICVQSNIFSWALLYSGFYI